MLASRWAGRVFGTNTGNVFVHLDESDQRLTGMLRFMDSTLGLAVYRVEGTFDGSLLKLEGLPTQGAPNIELGTLQLAARLTPSGMLEGDWTSSIGTAGTFMLHPHEGAMERAEVTSPEQLHTAVRTVGAVRLYVNDIGELVEFLGRDFESPRVVVTYRDRGSEITRYAHEFLQDAAKIGTLHYLKLGVAQPEAHGLNRNAVIELNTLGVNEIRVQSIQESWALGKAEALAAQLRKREKFLATNFRQFGLNLNGLIAISTLAVLPELPLGRRAIFLTFAVLVSWMIVQLHSRYIPNATIFLAENEPSPLARAWPQVLSWVIAATSGLAAAIVYGFLKGELSLPHLPS